MAFVVAGDTKHARHALLAGYTNGLPRVFIARSGIFLYCSRRSFYFLTYDTPTSPPVEIDNY